MGEKIQLCLGLNEIKIKTQEYVYPPKNNLKQVMLNIFINIYKYL